MQYTRTSIYKQTHAHAKKAARTRQHAHSKHNTHNTHTTHAHNTKNTRLYLTTLTGRYITIIHILLHTLARVTEQPYIRCRRAKLRENTKEQSEPTEEKINHNRVMPRYAIHTHIGMNETHIPLVCDGPCPRHRVASPYLVLNHARVSRAYTRGRRLVRAVHRHDLENARLLSACLSCASSLARARPASRRRPSLSDDCAARPSCCWQA